MRSSPAILAVFLILVSLLSVSAQTKGKPESERSWRDSPYAPLMDVVLPDFNALAAKKPETVSATLLRLQSVIAANDPSHRMIPIFVTPGLAEKIVQPWDYKLTNIPVGEAMKYLPHFMKVECVFLLRDDGVLCLTKEEYWKSLPEAKKGIEK